MTLIYYTESGNDNRLREFLKTFKYKKGWIFSIIGYGGRWKGLKILLRAEDSLDPGEEILVDHNFPIPDYPMSKKEIQNWLLEKILLVEQHETCEAFQVGDERPYFPQHGPGANSYEIDWK